MSHSPHVTVLGAGLAGTEAAWQIARAGVAVTLVEMRPIRRSPAHHSSDFAELVCSNSFGALSSDRAAGLLQEELRRLGSLVIGTADTHAVPAGGALAVDRGRYSAAMPGVTRNWRHPTRRSGLERNHLIAANSISFQRRSWDQRRSP